MDLRSTLGALSKLPFDGSKILEVAKQLEPSAANDEANEDHTTFWLAVADQFQKRGIDCSEVRNRAIELIDSGADLLRLKMLGMPPNGLRKRETVLQELRGRLDEGPKAARRVTLKNPQRLIMSAGDVLRYPTSHGKPINPYGRTKNLFGWTQDGWAAMLVVDCGLAFDYLAWYSIMTVTADFASAPAMQALDGALWALRGAGTCSSLHFRRMELAPLGTASIDRDAIAGQFGPIPSGVAAAIQDISISNEMRVLSSSGEQRWLSAALARRKTGPLQSFTRASETV